MVAGVFAFGLGLGALSLTSAIISDVAFPLEEKNVVYGTLFIIYPLFFAGGIIFVLQKLIRLLRKERGLVRLQLRYFFGGLLFSFITGSLVNIYLPIIGMTSTVVRNLGPLSLTIAISMITYAILRYRLMDIRLAFGTGLTYGFAVVILFVVTALPAYVMETVFNVRMEALFYYYIIFVAGTVVILFRPLRNGLESLVHRFYHRRAYDYFNALLAANKTTVTILDRDRLLAFLIDKWVSTIGIVGVVFFLRGLDGRFIPVAERRPPAHAPEDNGKARTQAEVEHAVKEGHALEDDSEARTPGRALISHLEEHGDVLLFTDLRGLAPREKGQLLARQMAALRAEAAVPVIIDRRLEGIFFLGSKISGEPYSQEDVKLLATLVSQVAISLKNAQLYQEVLVMKRYLENVLENIGNGLIAVDWSGTITTFNSAAERLTGISAGEALGKKADEVLDPAISGLIVQAMETAEAKSKVELELQAGEAVRFVSCSTAVVEAPESGRRGAILVMSDVTQVKELEREKSQIERLASLGQVAAGIAHEIKNPLVSIKTFAELLPEKYENPEFRLDFSRIVSQEIERINNLVTELLSFTRSSRLQCEEVDAEALMDEVLLLLSPQMDRQNVRVKRQYDPGVRPLWADKNQLKQAFLNVCLNGIQAMTGGGELRISILAESGRDHTGKDIAPGGKVKIVVEDTGVGISAKEKDRVFDPFFTTKPEGVGIGLSISHKIVVDHGGTIQIRSRQGEGATFEICLPVAG
jgi:PAS domain S-box-containing protein